MAGIVEGKVAIVTGGGGAIGGAISRLLVSVEQYPELKSQENFGRFMTQFEGSENRIRVAIRDYNEAVRQYNTTIRTFPSVMAAKIVYGSKPMTPYQAVTPGAEVAPTLNMQGANLAAPPANDNAAAQPMIRVRKRCGSGVVMIIFAVSVDPGRSL